MKYESQLEGMAHYEVNISRPREDKETLYALKNGLLPMRINYRHLPVAVWRYKASFQLDPSKELELLIGEYIRGMNNPLPLGMHDGETWTYEPLTISANLRVAK